jgi:hypothetical protein
MLITLRRKFDFEAAQHLPSFPEGHKCRQLHGHSFSLELCVSGVADPKSGLLYDHAKIAEAEPHPVRKTVQSLWDIMIVRGLGLIPIRDATHTVDQKGSNAFEILRVSSAQTLTFHE